MHFFVSLGAVLLPFASLVGGIAFNPDDEASIRSATASYAHGLMTYYKNNASGTAKTDIGIFPKPLYWWEAGAAWGALIEYTQLTGDNSYVDTLTEALVANYGPNNDIVLDWRKIEEGNDDQAFWAFSIMSALEYQFPDPKGAPATYLQVATNAFNTMVARWDTQTCGGGLKWQIYPDNAYGWNYKNSISNGAVFALAARMARYTGNQTYADWAVKIWDWSTAVGFVSKEFQVFDGAGDKPEDNCSKVDTTEWSYNVGVFLHGAATMFDYTKGDKTWQTRTSGLLDHAGSKFFKPYDNATDIMFEQACETGETGRQCNLDQQSFKAYLARFMSKTAILAPFTKDKVTQYLQKSAAGAAKSCSGAADACGTKWYTGGWDGTSGVGQQLSALEVTQALLTLKKDVKPGTAGNQKPLPSPSTRPSAPAKPSYSAISRISGSPSPVHGHVSSAGAASPPVTATRIATEQAPAAHSTAKAVSTMPPGNFAESPRSCTLSSTVTVYYTPTPSKCTTSSTVTVYYTPPPVQTVPTVPSSGVPAAPNGTAPISPPANATQSTPPLFEGAAVHLSSTGNFILAGVAVAIYNVL